MVKSKAIRSHFLCLSSKRLQGDRVCPPRNSRRGKRIVISRHRWLKIVTPGIAAVVLITIVGFSYRQWEQFRRSNAEAARTREIGEACNRVLSDMVDAETGQRGYLLTGESRYLDPYNLASRALPADMAALKALLAESRNGSQRFGTLNGLVNDKLAELRRTIEIRRSEGSTPALAIVLSDQGKRTMDAIRALCRQIQQSANSTQSQTSVEGETAAGTVLLATVAAALVLLFLFAVGLEPFASPEPVAWQRPWPLRYGAAVLAVVAIALFRAALTPLIGPTNLPFSMFFFAVAFAAWFGGLRPALLSIALSLSIGAYFFAAPTGSLRVSGRDDQVAMLMIVVVGFGIALLSRSQRDAVDRALRSENSERAERQRFEATLAGIGDAVIATDAEGRVTFANQVALELVRWPEGEILGKALDSVFQIVNEVTRAKVESPVNRVLREGKIVGLANHTVLIASDGTEVPIDDSAAPLRGGDGAVEGAVLVFRDITERRRAEVTSRLLSSIVDSSEDAIISKDANGIIMSWNQGAERLFGYSSQEMIGKPITMLAPPDRQEEMREILERLRRGEQVKNYDAVRRTKSGTLIHVSVSVSPIRDASGRIVGGSKIARDVSEQVEAQRELAAQREQLSGIIDSAMDAIVTVDQSQQIKLFNGAAERVFQCSASEALGHSLDLFIPERFRQAHRKHIERFGEAGTTSRSMFRPGVLFGLRRNGEEFPLEASISQIEKDGEKLFTVILRDITERTRVEDELHRERERLGLALTAGKMGVYEMNRATGILWWSPETYSLFCIKPEEFSLTRDSFAELIHPVDRELFMRYWDENIAQSQPVNNEFRILLPDGKERWLSCKGLSLAQYDDDRQPLRHTGIFLDITERKDAEQVLRKFEKLSAAARLSAAIAHEINNPLSAVVNLVYLAKGAPGMPESIVEQLALAEQELERVTHAARQALGFYREAAPSEQIDVPVLIDSVLKIYSGKIMDKKIQIKRDFVKAARVYAVRGELRQVVSNLITNAIEAVAEGGTILVGSRSARLGKDGAVEIVVADDGRGIPRGDLDRIFEPFFTTKPKTGTGLGLWVAKEIVERHRGTIAVSIENAEGHNHGATFTVTLPAVGNRES